MSAQQAKIYKALGHPIRLSIARTLYRSEEGQEVGWIQKVMAAFNLSQPAISQQLKKMKQAGILDSKREGRHIIYFMEPAVKKQLKNYL